MAKKGKQSSGAAPKAPKCTCDDPFKCMCGNRPERPSRGHKWDPVEQQWAGKGHKQKGGSGQISQVGSAAKTTEKGQTTLAMWQKLPSSLLADVCRKEKRPDPKYKALSSHGGKHQYRVIVQDAKESRRGGEHDLILVPASAVKNEEQAKEEAALLALLHLTPKIPHERMLPEPYKSTWVNALEARKESQSKPKAKVTPVSGAGAMTKAPASGSGSAAASSNLMNANTFTSFSEKRKKQDEKKKDKNAKIRRHEAMRMANRDVQVFMSAQVRKQIETLLRGDADEALMSALVSESDASMDTKDDEGNDDVVLAYVIQRLTHEGFTVSQSRAGYTAVLLNPSVSLRSSMNSNEDEDEYMDKLYDECLQWLCIHINEDQVSTQVASLQL